MINQRFNKQLIALWFWCFWCLGRAGSWGGIGQVLSGRSKHCNGYVFEYYETNIDGEQWRDHPDGFKVSDHGRIEYPTGKRTYGTKSYHGYMYLHFKSKKQRIHRLVLELFAGPPPLNHEADHIDRNRANNHISNLRWRSNS